MNTTKKIYFLAAFVLIIGCFALNLSYSLFIQTEEKEIANATVPELIVGLSPIDNTVAEGEQLSTSYVIVEAGKEYLIKQTITNSSNVAINYSLLTDKPDNVSIAIEKNTPKNLPYGFSKDGTALEANTSKDLYFVVSNKDGEEDIDINFTLKYNYSTIMSNIESSNIMKEFEINLGTLPYSENPRSLAFQIIQQQVDKFGGSYKDSDGGISELFVEGKVKVRYPLDLNVPSPLIIDSVETQEVGLYKTEDDYGISYYYRGANSYNYVNFAGLCWRVVRIEGDGSVKLILEDYDQACDSKDVNSNLDMDGNWSDGNNVKFGYKSYGSSTINHYADFINFSGGLADSLKSFQLLLSNKISEKYSNKTIMDKLKVDEWCYDDSIWSNNDGSIIYSALSRILYNNQPSLKCTGTKVKKFKDSTDMYVGTLTADELSFAGADTTDNYNFYLMNKFSIDNNLGWWTLSLYYNYYFEDYGRVYLLGSAGILSNEWAIRMNYNYPIRSRPAITINSEIEVIEGGEGTMSSPYIIS